jgi:hypothetical protein
MIAIAETAAVIRAGGCGRLALWLLFDAERAQIAARWRLAAA